ncbi:MULTISPECIES: STM3941 family protein [Tenacibaculum]|uniref:STM3941 family protein n=1 Tax=Tenacibaculum TaxID=104267 RepID=UPI001F254949|nr:MULTISPECIES: STM3941 family protein [Tenacibaculum]MCF2873404.1 hypothetical protein [Tenacibaculum sp. Cn5-1]MCF2933560.1 hypothetical protein [Tenacibaculum sp. Cn5-34]MCG7509858.1 hypothetical protein [Tenacibaculum sp. Cn5-46]
MENQTRIFKQNKLKSIILIIICTAFVIIGISMLEKQSLVAWLQIMFFGLGIVVFFIQLLPNSSYLKLNNEGFEVRSLYRSTFTKWTDVTSFKLGKLHNSRMILFDYSDQHKKWKNVKKLSKLIANNEGGIQTSYKIPSSELVEILNQYKQRSEKNQQLKTDNQEI